MYLKLIILFLLAYTLLPAQYILKKSKRRASAIDHMPKGVVADMKNIPQDPAYYAKQIKPFSTGAQRRFYKEFVKKYFKPWSLSAIDIPQADLGWEVRFVQRRAIYKANGAVIPPSVYNRWIENANYKNMNARGYRAITVKHTNIKAFPTATAFYRNPAKVGQGFPFDYNQNSALHINVPLFVSHFSKDRRWAFVRASYSFGWVRVSDLAIVKSSFIRAFKSGSYAMTIRDNMRLFNEKNRALTLVKLGALFPISADKKHYLVAKRTAKAQAQIEYMSVQDSKSVAKMPLAFTAKNVAKIAKEFYGEPYGWGGGYGCRDCSATTRDFFGPFGIFLHRNSSKQTKDGSSSVNIKKLPVAYKKRFINQHAKPFRTLLYVPGHIGLYLGEFKGEPVIMHTYWGVRKKDGSKLVTGRTIITTTQPGNERKDTKKSSQLIHTLKTMVNFN